MKKTSFDQNSLAREGMGCQIEVYNAEEISRDLLYFKSESIGAYI